MQALYMWDFYEGKREIDEILAYLKAEFAANFDDHGFVDELVKGVIENVEEINATITKYAPAWPLPAIMRVDRNVLRLGVYELRWCENIPAKVAINEAIELAKGFGGESSGRFVNGVLGAVFRDLIANGVVKKVDVEDEKKKEAAAPAVKVASEPTAV